MLASSQGGSSDAQAQPPRSQKGSDTGKMASFIDKGEAILNTMTATLKELSQHSRKLDTVVKNVERLQADVGSLKRKLPAEETQEGDGPSCSKRQSRMVEETTFSDSDSEEVDRLPDDLDVDTLFDPQLDTEQVEEDDFLDDLEQFFEEKTTTGDKVSEKLSRIADSSLRGTVDEEKYKQLKEKYRRPENILNLQTPQVDPFIWKKLDKIPKVRDVQIQRASAQISQCLVPVVRTLDILQSSSEVDKGQLRGLVTDTFKMMVSSIASNIKVRRGLLL